MYVVALAAIGCMGWKLGQWMAGHNAPRTDAIAFLILGIALVLLIALLVVGGRGVVWYCSTAPALALVLLLARTPIGIGPDMAILIFGVLVWSVPLAFFLGSVRLALDSKKPLAARIGFLIPATFIATWMVSAMMATW